MTSLCHLPGRSPEGLMPTTTKWHTTVQITVSRFSKETQGKNYYASPLHTPFIRLTHTIRTGRVNIHHLHAGETKSPHCSVHSARHLSILSLMRKTRMILGSFCSYFHVEGRRSRSRVRQQCWWPQQQRGRYTHQRKPTGDKQLWVSAESSLSELPWERAVHSWDGSSP